MVEELIFNVLLDKIPSNEFEGFRFGGVELKASGQHREGHFGVCDSVQAVQEAGLLQVPTYAYVNGRSFANFNDSVWSEFDHSLGERLVLRVNKSYKEISQGDFVVDVQGGGLFMPRHKVIRHAICKYTKLCDNTMLISSKDKDLLLGERVVYRWDGKKVQKVPVTHFFTSYEQFLHTSGTPEFQKSLRDLSAVYVVLRSVSEAKQNRSGYLSIKKQLANPDWIIPSGGKENLSRILMERSDKEGKQVSRFNPRFEGKSFGSLHDGYDNIDTGNCGIFVSYHENINVNFCNGITGIGNSCGVAPEALNAWRDALHEAQTRENSLKGKVK